MKAIVTVMPKDGILDPQGQAIKAALGSLGFEDVKDVRQGKIIELNFAAQATEKEIKKMCEMLLANTVIESYRIQMD